MAAQRPRLADLSEDDRHELQSRLAEFDQNWGAGSLPGRANQIPPGSSWRLPALAEMVKIDLQRQWQAGHRVSLESYLLEFPELGHRDNVSVDLIQAEYDVRRQFGAPAEVDNYARRFPNQAAELRRAIQPRSGSAGRPPHSVSGRPPANRSQDLPEQFGRYRIIKRLGQGGMGSVYLADDTELGRQVALKVALAEADASQEARERFTREARAAATLDHPYLCPVYDIGTIDGIPYLTMAYIPGRSLASTIPEGGLPPRQVAALIGKLAVALQEAHAKGVVHRDLKPSNVMIKETGQRREPVIVDFGLARQENTYDIRVTKTGQAIGTPAYMAPEQIHGDLKEIGPACDIYALGVILYEMLTGRLPFQGPLLAVVGQILTQEPAPPSTIRPGLAPRLEAICLKAMAKRVKDRHSSMGELAAALTGYLKDPTPSSVSTLSQASGSRPEGTEARAAGSDTLVGQFLDRVAAENASNPVLIQEPRVITKPRPAVPGRRPPWPVVVAASAFILGLGIVLYVATSKGRIKIVVDDPRAVIKIDGDEVRIEKLGKPITLRAGAHELTVRRGDAETETRMFVVRRGDNVPLHVEYEPATVVLENVPEDADVLVDGGKVAIRRTGDQVSVQAVPGKTYSIRAVRKNGDTLLSRDVEVRAGARPVRLRVESYPSPGKATAATLTGKLPPPSADRVAELQRATRDAVKTELASGKPAELSRLAQSFLTRAAARDRPDERYALLDQARDLLAQAGDLPGALDACARLDREFLIEPVPVKVRTLRRLARAGGTPDAQVQLLEAVLAAGFEALATDSFGPSRDAVKIAIDLARSQGGDDYADQARFLADEVARAESAYARLPVAAKAADEVTSDPRVNTARGLFACLVKNDWAKGTDFLRAGTAPWQGIAEQEEKRPTSATEREALGNLWWQAADGLPAVDAQAARRRARYWYLGALSEMQPPEREAAAGRLQPRIDQVPRTPMTLRVRLTGLNGYHWLRISSDGVVTSKRGGRHVTGDIRVNHLGWTDHVEGHRNTGAARLLPDGLDFSTTQLVRLAHGGWFGATHVALTPGYVELMFWHQPWNERSHYDLTLKVESSGYNLPSRFARQWDVAYYNCPEKKPLTDDTARAALFATEPADRLTMDSINFLSEASPQQDDRPGAPPTKKVGADYFALVATSTRQIPAGRYKVQIFADDGSRVLIDGQVVLDNWRAKEGFRAASEELRLSAGAHQIRVEYHQGYGAAILQFDLVRLGD